jgi:glycosyltransferase involved in cell wall biosynthesis
VFGRLRLAELKVNPILIACIPAYREERSIALVVLKTRKYVDQVIVCDDGSGDSTGDLAEALGAMVLRHESNKGKGAAMRTLLHSALKYKPSAIILLDADGQHDPSDIPQVVAPILSREVDFVIGSRFTEGGKADIPFYRRLGLWVLGSSANPKNIVTDSQSGFRAFTPEIAEYLLSSEAKGFGIESEMISLVNKKGLRIKEVPIEIKYKGVENPSKMNPLLHGGEVLAMLIRLATEDQPLIILGIPGLTLVLWGIYAGLVASIQFSQSGYFSVGWAVVMMVGLILGVSLGIAALILYAIQRLKVK